MTIAFAMISALLAASPIESPGVSAAPSPTPSAIPNAIAIYHRAIAAMKAADEYRPAYAVYQLDYTGHNLVLTPETTNGKTAWNMDLHHANDSHAYQIWYRSHDDKALTQDRTTHYIYRGEALLAPVAANVLESASPSPRPSTSPSQAASSAPDTPGGATTEVLGSVSVEASQFYDITLVGIENNRGHEVFHLHLHAHKDIPEHPLTDLFIDTATYLVRAAHAEVTLRGVIFALGVAVDVAYEPVGAYWLLDDLHFHGNGYALFYHANMDCTMVLHDFILPTSLPDSYFAVPATP
jgi:hypothetical protein